MPKQAKAATLEQVVCLLDKTSRVMQTMSERIDLLAFGQTHNQRRIAQLENWRVRTVAKNRKRR